ncbi:MAG TPA: DUF3108 domain-containing protein [Bryobacteraceae bacterium]|nr:DUF3108 domain-containing protein [Bryobacteraceae bacterium]
MRIAIPILTLVSAVACLAEGPLTGFPFTDESLSYTISWPSGLNLGEVRTRAHRDSGGWEFSFSIDAGIPGFPIKDNYSGRANADFCSTEFERDFSHGARKSTEKTTIDRSIETATRKTIPNGGGQSEFSIPDCVKDALTFLFYTRREMGQGRVPTAQRTLFGGLYDVSLVYAGEQTIQIAKKPVVTDKLVGSVKGPASSQQFEIYFARDPARTPLLVKVPLSVGAFSMELVR